MEEIADERYDEENLVLEEFYNEDSVKELIEDDEISAEEEGFMQGYIEAGEF
jgi:hypothetical protein